MLHYASALLDGFWTHEVNGAPSIRYPKSGCEPRPAVQRRTGLTQVLVEPGDHAQQHVLLVGRCVEGVAFVRIDHHLGLHAERLEGAPELVRLRGWAFAVAITHYDQGGSLHLLDEVDGGHFAVYRGVVVDRSAEIGNHPGVDGVLTVVALPVGDAGASHSGLKASGLGHGKHGHEAAIAPAGDADSLGIDGCGPDGFI